MNPTNQTVAQNSTVTFVVNAVGTEPLSYQWQANGVNLLNGGRISGATNSTLTVSGVLTGDAKSYSVIVTNNIGSVTSSPPAVLMVLTSPLFSSIATDTNGNFVLSGIGNVSGNTYYVLASTNLATPLAEWTPIATNYFGSQGQFIFTNIPPTNTPQQFYILQSQ
ncbi:MAG: immunoglobulin domain-containing protein [Limisphaerales bacterium]